MADVEEGMELLPPKALLTQLIRMGSFTSSRRLGNEDVADNDLDLREVSCLEDLLQLCQDALEHLPRKIPRTLHRAISSLEERTRGQHNASKVRVMQWNILSQALSKGSDNFVACPDDALTWQTRRWRLLEEILTYRPDILCLQEVDHYMFFKRTLGVVNYNGTFFPKPDSPCLYITGNNGPDGCAIFYDTTAFDLLRTETRVLEVWGCQCNQVAILCHFQRKSDGALLWVATTHLKARQGPLLSTMRNEQGKDLLDFVKVRVGNDPAILAGDFNADPCEPVYWSMTGDEVLRLDSAYCYLTNKHKEPPYTSWKIREEGEFCETLDYIFFTSDRLNVASLLNFPTESQIGESRVPSYQYPSDHFSLVCDFEL